MSLIAKSKGGNYKLMPSDTYIARCFFVIDLGTQMETIMGKPPAPTPKVRLGFEFPTMKAVFDEKKGEEPFTLSLKVTNSLHEKATLRKTLENWRGRTFTPEELKEGFDLAKVLGIYAQVTVNHKAKADKSLTAVIASIVKPMQGIAKPPPFYDTMFYNIEEGKGGVFPKLPEWIQKEILQSMEFRGVTASINAADASPEHDHAGGDDGDPF